MRVGKLRERIELKRKTLADDGAGGATETPTTYATVWAEVMPMTGRERERSMRAEASSDYVITIRFRDDVVEGDIIAWRGREMNIRFVRDAGAHPQYLVLEAEKGAAV